MDITDSVTYHITKTGNLLRQLSAKRIKEVGLNLTPEEAVLMNQLWDKKEQTLSDLGQWSIKDASTLTRQIDSLEKKGYVLRRHSTDDRRKVFVDLTESGKQLQKTFIRTRIPQMDNEVAELSSEDLAVFLKVVRQIKENAVKELKGVN